MATSSFNIKVNVQDGGDIEKIKRALAGLGATVNSTTKSTAGASKNQADLNRTMNQGVAGIGNSTKSFSKLAETIGGESSGIVGAYATLAANIFAVSAAFNALRNASQVEQIFRGLEAAGTRTGLSLISTSNALKEVSGNAVSAEQAMRSTAQIVSAGFKEDTVVRLGQAAKDASFALGRNMTDSLDRLSRGIVKLEPELLDELGIMTKLTESNVNYARTLGKSESQLTNFEKRQGFANAVLAEAELKFGGISKAAGDSTAYDRLAATFTNLTNSVFGFLSIFGKPIAGTLGSSIETLLGVGILFASTLKNQLIPGLAKSATVALANAEAFRAVAKQKLDAIKVEQQFATAQAQSALASKKNFDFIGATGPKVYQNLAAAVRDGTASAAEQQKALVSLQRSYNANQQILANNAGFGAGTAKGAAKIAQNEQIFKEILAIRQLQAAQAAADAGNIAGSEAVTKARLAARVAGLQAYSQTAAAASIGAASQLKVAESWKQLTLSVASFARAQTLANAGSLGFFGTLRTGAFAASVAFRAMGTALLAALPYIGLAVVAFGLLKSVYEGLKSDAVKNLEKATATLSETTNKANDFGNELIRITNSQATASQRAAARLTLQGNAISEVTGKFSEFAEAFRNVNVADKALLPEAEMNKVASFWETLGNRASLSYLNGLKKGSKTLDIAEAVQGKNIFGFLNDDLSAGSKEAIATLNSLEQANKKSLDSVIKSRGGWDKFKASLKGVSELQVVNTIEAIGNEVDKLTAKDTDIKDFQEAFKALGNSLSDFNRSAILSTPYDTLVKNFQGAEKSAKTLQAALNPKEFSELLSGLDGSTVRTLNLDTQKDIEEYNKASAIVQALLAKRKELGKLNATDSLELNVNQKILDNSSQLGANIAKQIGQRTLLVQQAQEENRLSQSRLAILNAQIQANARIYAGGAAGMKARIQAEERSRAIQVNNLKTQIETTRVLSGNLQQSIVQLDADKQRLEVAQALLENQKNFGREQASNLLKQTEADLARINLSAVDADRMTKNGLRAVSDVSGDTRTTAVLVNNWRKLKTIMDSTVDTDKARKENALQLAGIDEKRAALVQEARDSTQQIKALENQITTIVTANLTPQQKAAQYAEAQRQYYSGLVNTLNDQAKSLGEINETYRSTQAIVEGTSDRLSTQNSQIVRNAQLERDNLKKTQAVRLDELKSSLAIAKADAARAKGSDDVAAAQAVVQFAQNGLTIAQQDYNISLQKIDATQVLSLLEKNMFDTRSQGLEWQQDSLNYLQKQVDVQRSLAEEVDKSYELQLKIKAARTGIAVTSYGDDAMEIRSATTAYKYALQEVELKKGLIDLEYALLDAQRENMKADLASRREMLSQVAGAEAQVTQLDSILDRLGRVDLGKAAETAKNTVDRQLENSRQTLELALSSRSSYKSMFSDLLGVGRDIELKRKAAATAIVELEKSRQAAEKTAIVANKPVIAASNPLVEVNKTLINKIQDWIVAIGKTQDANLASIGGGETAGGINPTASAVTKQIVSFFTSKGYTLNQAAGIAGNVAQESGNDPHRVNKVSGNAGLFQLSAANQKLFAAEFGHAISQSTVAEQLKFVNSQLDGSEGAAKRLLKAANDIAEAAVAFRKGYERPGKAEANDASRIAYARKAVTIGSAKVAAPRQAANDNSDIVVQGTRPPTPSINGDMPEYKSGGITDNVEAIAKSIEIVNKAPKDFSVLETSMASINPVIEDTIANLAKLGPDGEAVSLVLSGMNNFGSSVLNTLKVIDEQGASTTEKFVSIAGAISAGLTVASSAIAATAQMKETAIDREIAAEQKRDGKSAESVAKIAGLEAKKDSIAKKAFETNKKIQMAQAVLSTASGIAMALANPFPYNLIAAGIVGAAGAVQLGVIAGTQYQSSASSATNAAASTPATLTIGKSGDTVDLAKQNNNVGGELGYLRGKQGVGSNASNYSVIGSAYGGELPRGYGNSAYVVGEKGPETIVPMAPMTVVPANDNSGSGNGMNATIHISALDSAGVEDILVKQKGNIIAMLREAANANGQQFLPDVNVSTYSRPNTANRL